MADTELYVERGYAPAGYINNILQGVATLSVSASTSASGGFLREGTATLSVQGTQTATGGNIKAGTASVSATATQTASAVATKAGTASASTNVTQTTAGVATKVGSATIDGALNATVQGNATVSPGGDFVVTASMTSSAKRFAGLSATLITAGDEVQWDDGLTWQEPRSEYWGPLFAVSAIKVTGLVTDTKELITTATMSVDAVRTARIDITVDSFASMSVQGLQISEGTTTMSSTATMDVAGVATNGILNEVLESNFALTSAAQVIISGEATLNTQFTNSTQGNYTTGSVSKTLDTEATFTLSGNAFRLRRFSTSISSAFTVEVDADRVAGGTVLQASAGTMSVKANPLWGPYQQSLDAEATIFINGGVLRDGSATLNALNAVLATLTIYNIDPYRIYTIPTESRIATIEADTRIFSIDSENRLNTLEKETRTIQIDSESRYLEVQRLRLFDQFGVKDRREG